MFALEHNNGQGQAAFVGSDAPHINASAKLIISLILVFRTLVVNPLHFFFDNKLLISLILVFSVTSQTNTFLHNASILKKSIPPPHFLPLGVPLTLFPPVEH